MPITQERVRDALLLNDAGVFVWRNPSGSRAKPGMLAGSGTGSRCFIGIDGTRYPAAHLKHLYVHGSLPDGFLDAGSGKEFDKRPVKRGEKLTSENIRTVLNYDQETGVFTWLARTAKCVRIGDVVGSESSNGYLRTHIFGREYLLHRLAWFFTHGVWPERIDHIDGDRRNNRIENLRDVSARTNSENQRKATRQNRIGVLGVRQRSKGSFAATIGTNGKSKHLGSFRSAEAAHAAYIEAKRRIHAGCTL